MGLILSPWITKFGEVDDGHLALKLRGEAALARLARVEPKFPDGRCRLANGGILRMDRIVVEFLRKNPLFKLILPICAHEDGGLRFLGAFSGHGRESRNAQ